MGHYKIDRRSNARSREVDREPLPYRKTNANRAAELIVMQAVVNANGRRDVAAQCLGITRFTVYRAMARYADRCAREAEGLKMGFC